MTKVRNADYAALLLRVSLGALFLAHGLLKVFVFTLPGTAKFFESLGYPPLLADVVVAAEIGGGLALIFGIVTRLVSVALIPVMIGALIVHLPNGWLFSNAKGGWEFPALWTALLIVQALLGPGAFAVRLPRAEERARETSAS
ncbi:DoxX family protein [Methylosinus sporium]|uniref:DoxX family protein n=1 Tax=Methylosinus sporium TaxID=428 RepID=A0A2U1SM12_METSR|nr:DoxX family protein [Methylosinus sporium]PWB92658.1 hypothetical protein C5689_16970 [Methylosinus sporium]